MSDKRLTPAEAAARLRVSTDTVYKLLKTQKIGYFPIGRKKLIPEDEITAYEQQIFTPAVVSLDEHRLRSQRAV